MARRGWRNTRAGRFARAELADAQPAHGERARLFDVARPIDEMTLPQAVRRLVGTHAAERRAHADRERLERTRIIQRRVRHAVVQERFGRDDACLVRRQTESRRVFHERRDEHIDRE